MELWSHLSFLVVANTTLCQFAALVCAFKLLRSLPGKEARRLAKAGLLLFGSASVLFFLVASGLAWRDLIQAYFDQFAEVGGPVMFAVLVGLVVAWLSYLAYFRYAFVLESTEPDSVIQGRGRINEPANYFDLSVFSWVLVTFVLWYRMPGMVSYVSLVLMLLGNQVAFTATCFGRPVLITRDGLRTGFDTIPFSQIERVEYSPIQGPLGPYQVSCWLSRRRLLTPSKQICFYGVTEKGVHTIEGKLSASATAQAILT